MKRIKVGDIVKFKTFNYTNEVGGTSSANTHPITDSDIYFKDIAEGIVIYEFEDYECGQRLHVKLSDKFYKLIKDKSHENKVYVSEFEVLQFRKERQNGKQKLYDWMHVYIAGIGIQRENSKEPN